MSTLRFEFEWQDPAGARGEELRATWASLSILIDGKPVTELHDRNANSVRTSVFLPMFPLAEWIVNNWWFIQSEYRHALPSREADLAYHRRHNIRWAREGFALPSLEFVPLGDAVNVRWQQLDLPDARIKFTEVGEKRLTIAVVEDELRRFVDAVQTRLTDQNITTSSLHEEWAAIQNADADERAFCKAAAQLGIDPYGVGETLAEEIVRAATAIRAEIRDEFLSLTTLEQLSKEAASLAKTVQSIADDLSDVDVLQKVREFAPQLQRDSLPWEAGYRYATELRSKLGEPGWKSGSLEHLADRLQIDLNRCLVSNGEARSSVDALAGPNGRNNPKFLIEKTRPDSRQFAFCRALFELLTSPRNHFVLVSRLQSDRQQRNRAFAAEFLAPHEMLRKELSGHLVEEEEIDELSKAFGVSALVIKHQIENHRLAEVSD